MTSLRHYFTQFPWRAFGFLVIVLYLGHWLGAFIFAKIDELTHQFPHHHPWVMAVTSTVLLTGLVLTLHSLHHRHPRPKSIPFRFGLWLLSTLLVVTAFCAATWSEHAVLTIGILKNHPILFASLCVLGLVAVNRVLRDILRSIEGPEDIHQTDQPTDPPQTLILLVSLIPKGSVEFPESGPFAAVKTGPLAVPPTSYTLAGNNIDADIAALDGSRWPWQQLLRAIRPHQSLKKIVLIGSKNGSFQLLGDCRRLVAKYAPKGCSIKSHEEPIPFEDFNAIKRALRQLVVAEALEVGDGHVVIDVTGGQATTSIAAAAATIGTEAIFQYVQTNDPYNVLYYDVHNIHAPNPHGH